MIMLALMVLMHGFLLQIPTTAPTLPINLVPWFGISIIVALIVVFAAAAIYMLAPLINSSAMQQWARAQVYEAILSVALIIIFLFVVKFFFINPQPYLSSAGLVPQGCTGAKDIFNVSTCDLAQFNNAAYNLVGNIWTLAVIKGIIPSSAVQIQPVPQEGDGFEISFTIPSIANAPNDKLIRYVMASVITFLLISQIQLILLSSSLLLLSFFFAVGLISRIFGLSRSFGGAMIAFGIGLGLIYPLVTAITYGYLDVASNAYCVATLCLGHTSVGSFTTSFFGIMLSSIGNMLLIAGGSGTVIGQLAGGGIAQAGIQGLASDFAATFNMIGYVIAGLTVIPLVNILIVDVFIVDFSRAVGERMSFSMLFKGVI